jgi:hypothetical protein
MTVSSSTAKAGPYAGAGSPGPFTVPFRFLAASHLQVIRTSNTGIDTTLTLTTDYTVSGVGASSGSVTLTAPLASGERLTIIRNAPFTQLADYVNNDAFPAESHEDALDLLTMQTQQLKERSDAALTLPATVTGVDTDLPTPESSKLIGWNQAANALQNFDATTLATIVAFGTSRADVFTGDGAQTQFTLTANPGALANLDVAIGGVTQTPGVNFTFSGTTLTFAVAPPLGVVILARYFLALPQGVTDSAASTFLQAGTGAVPRTVQAKLREYLSPEDFGAVGNGIADDSAAWQNCLTASAGRAVAAHSGKTYLCLNELLVPPNTTVDLQGSRVNFNVTGSKYGFKMGGYTTIRNGRIDHTNTTNEPGVNGSFRSCVTVGSFNAGPGTGDNNVLIEHLEMHTLRPTGQCVSIYSDSSNITIRNCLIYNDSTAKNGIALHWSTDNGGAPPSGTRHPQFVTIENTVCADFDVGVYMSAAFAVAIRGCRFFDCDKGVECYRGDYSNAYAPASDAAAVAKGITIEACRIRGAQIGVEIDGIEGLPVAQQIMGVTIRDCLIEGRAVGASSDRGVYIRGTTRVTVSDCEIFNFDGYGVDLFGECQHITLADNIIRNNGLAAIWARDTETISDVNIERNRIFGNCAKNADSTKPHIRVGALCTRWRIAYNEFGAASEPANISIFLVTGCTFPTLHNNHTAFLAGGGWAYRVSGATTLATTATMRADVRGNTVASGITLWDGSPLSEVFGPLGNLQAYENAAPTVGTWAVGDRVTRTTPVVGQPRGWSCTVAGTPGTWVSEGNL